MEGFIGVLNALISASGDNAILGGVEGKLQAACSASVLMPYMFYTHNRESERNTGGEFLNRACIPPVNV